MILIKYVIFVKYSLKWKILLNRVLEYIVGIFIVRI